MAKVETYQGISGLDLEEPEVSLKYLILSDKDGYYVKPQNPKTPKPDRLKVA